jgi:hypothetical protein
MDHQACSDHGLKAGTPLRTGGFRSSLFIKDMQAPVKVRIELCAVPAG